MAEDKSIIGLIVKECCKGIEYDDILKQYSFALKPDCGKRWEKLRPRIKQLRGRCTIDGFNDILSQLQTVQVCCNSKHLTAGIDNPTLLPGESLEIRTDRGSMVLTKMGSNQYLSGIGKGITFPSNQLFQKESYLVTSEGEKMGQIEDVYLRLPTPMHIELGSLLLSGYYKRRIKDSLWELYTCSEYVRRHNKEYSKILDTAKELGIGILPMLTIINSFPH